LHRVPAHGRHESTLEFSDSCKMTYPFTEKKLWSKETRYRSLFLICTKSKYSVVCQNADHKNFKLRIIFEKFLHSYPTEKTFMFEFVTTFVTF